MVKSHVKEAFAFETDLDVVCTLHDAVYVTHQKSKHMTAILRHHHDFLFGWVSQPHEAG